MNNTFLYCSTAILGFQSGIMQEEVQKHQVDKHIYKLRKLNPSMTWKDIAQEIQQRFNLTCSINDLINRYEALIAKLPQQKIAVLFQEFQRWETNFQKISDRTSIGIDPVKREILSVLVNNIIKVCFIVRKRRISSLKSNFLSNQKIKELLILILSENNFSKVKQEYSIFWSFISKYYPNNHFATVSDEQYKSVYRELIILTEAFNINSTKEDTHTPTPTPDSFERKIIESAGMGNDKIKEMIELSRSKKKTQKETINLVSDDEGSGNEDNSLLGVQMREETEQKIIEGENKRQIKNKIVREAIINYYELGIIEQKIVAQPENLQLKEQRLEKVIALGCLKLLSLKIECQ